MPTLATSEIERVFREQYGRAVAVLARVFGDLDVAEDAVQEAFAAAVQRWPSSGLPPSPAGWIITTARNRAINRLRREASRHDRHRQALRLTPAGAAALDRWQASNAAVLGAALAGLPPAEQRTLQAALPALDRLIEQVDAIAERPAPGSATRAGRGRVDPVAGRSCRA